MAERSAQNRESYDAIAARWDAARTRLADAERSILDLLLDGVAPGASVLDLGCGTGRPIAEHLVARGLAVTGVDQSPRMLDLARARLPRETWLASRIEDFAPPAAGFAAAIAWDSLFHVPREHHAGVFARVRTALRPGARFALTVGGSAQPAFTDTMLDHTFFYDSHPPDEASALLRAAGFTMVRAEFLSLPTTGRDKGRYAIVAAAS
jgi:cyclopropane fatty-acyl-phospholipid synthase-like methyltransferase